MAIPHAILLLLSPMLISAAPQASASDSDPDPTTYYVPTATTSTVTLNSATPTNVGPADGEDATPIDANKFFYVSNKCSAAHQAFYKTAYEGAVAIAYAASKWPMYGTDVSDIYFGKGSENNPAASSDIPANLQRASEWNTGEIGFDDYMILECPEDDPTIGNHCNGKIGGDPRPIGCYVNHTVSWGWDKDWIRCCGPFFDSFNIEQQYQHNKGKNPLDARELQNSGHLLLHEMMHAYRLTLDRPRLIDETFDGPSGRRIYGAVDVAKAARIYGITLTQTNADSYAQFANAMYWKDRLGSVPQPSVKPTPANFIDMVSDGEDDYYVDVRDSADTFTPSESPPPTGLDTLATPLPTDEPVFVTGPVSVSMSTVSSSAAPSSTSLPPPKCNGLSSNKYIVQPDLSGNIMDYCTQAGQQGKQDPNSGSLGRTFNKGTPEETDITMTWPPGQPLPNCNDPLNSIMNNCDGNDPNNPMDWKGGGSITWEGTTYTIQPTAQRQPPPKAPGGQCQESGLKFNLWGVGWENTDSGSCLKTNFNGCSGSGYSFNYGNGNDGREWTMNGWLGPGQGNCAHDAIITCGGPSIYCQ